MDRNVARKLVPTQETKTFAHFSGVTLPEDVKPYGLIVETLKYKDPYTYYHSKRVAAYVALTCMQMGMAQRETGVYVLAGLAHDIGKLGTPDRVLKKPGRLTQDEFLIMKAHASHSAQLLHRLSASDELSLAVRHHHERIDGFGYPDGLKGDQVPIGARIILVADTYDAMTSDRSYRRGCGPAIAFDELRNCSGSQFDGAVVEAFIKGMQELQKDELHLIEDFVERICKS